MTGVGHPDAAGWVGRHPAGAGQYLLAERLLESRCVRQRVRPRRGGGRGSERERDSGEHGGERTAAGEGDYPRPLAATPRIQGHRPAK
jgi:hypothetical protein